MSGLHQSLLEKYMKGNKKKTGNKTNSKKVEIRQGSMTRQHSTRSPYGQPRPTLLHNLFGGKWLQERNESHLTK